MDRSHYKAMVHSQEQQRTNAWTFIFQSWNTATWNPLPSGIKMTLGLPMSIGVCSGMLVTRTGAQGLTEFVNRMNSKRSTE